MPKKKETEYRIGYYWDDQLAEYAYILQQDSGSSFKESDNVAEGNKEWAERTAKHYGIDVPTTPEEKEAAKNQPTTNPITTTSTQVIPPTYPTGPNI